MIRMASISRWLFLIAVASAFAQPSTITDAKVYTAEDYSITVVALNHFFAQRKPNRVLLLSHTVPFSEEPFNLAFPGFKEILANVPDRATVNFDSHNKSQAKIEGNRLKTSFKITLLSAEDEGRLIGGCQEKTPVTFVSRPGLNAEHNRALISVGTSCFLNQDRVLMLLGKDRGHWRVLNELVHASSIIDIFPSLSR